ncbi:hypothetical protein CLOACE_14550 [Clostridium acetireducens DSM 10703]|uniref:RelA/SpoT domain-containing protein n=1 Tax=Clostridium acetireducens DSM 10703 TaxID=1121290 RepID=A0A1E8EY56_9CLOT|nr:hypothetical protein [Clostridium acetireducens]OFI05910.1 hypothetical protein CLOACE_14550 [Clostridium acetireducens DSM 10703]
MGLQIFEFIDETTHNLENIRGELEIASRDLEKYLDTMLIDDTEGYLNITSRVKSSFSLKEKIIRNNYYKKYSSPEEVLYNLSDLIGVRIECRFIEDENGIYKFLKKFFNRVYKDGMYYNANNEKIRLDLSSQQPQVQKNGFKIYKIDGVYDFNDKKINFELQIKSLVNIFWGEIEHKIIYKNYNYMLTNKFFKEMMDSIKSNLSMMDNQLLIIYEQFNKINSTDESVRKSQMEAVLSKIIYDIFSRKIKNNIGFIMDFRKSCDLIMEYIFRSNNAENLDEYNSTLLTTLNRLNEIGKNDVDFNSEITFERTIILEDDFSRIVGESILKSINVDFHWNLFFRILFEIELGNNAEDFETFISFLKNRFYENESFVKLNSKFNFEEKEHIKNSIMIKIAYAFKEVNSIDFIHENTIKEINRIVRGFINIICNSINSYDEWINMKNIYLELLYIKILSIFNYNIDTKKVIEIIDNVKENCKQIEISERVLKYIGKIDKFKEMRADEVIDLFKLL